jgi:cell division cycle 2-like protein
MWDGLMIGEIVALKKLKMEREREGFPITSLREINTLLKAKHENIVHVREIVVGSNMDKIFIVMDYVEHDLKSLMETMKQPFLEGEVKTLLIQLLKAVHHLHDNWILHRDLKTSNLLLSHKGILKVADFGLAREYGSPLLQYTPIVVTLWYRSPELLLGAQTYTTSVDVWSVGCIFAELLQHSPLFMGRSEIDQLNQIFKELGTPNESIWPGFNKLPIAQKVQFTLQPLNNMRKRFPIISKNGFSLLNRFFAYDPQRRIPAGDALKHDYFQESPLPVDPNMFPTWPAKSEMIKKSVRPKSPTAPEGGAFLLNSKLLKDDESTTTSTTAITNN